MTLRSIFPAVILASATLGFAQAESFDAYASNLALLQDKRIQTELGITEAQRKTLNSHAEWYNAQTASVQKAAPNAKTQAQQQELSKRLQSLMGQMKTRCLKVLTRGQTKRLRELSLQLQGPAVLLDDRVAKEVGANADQLKKMRALYEGNIKKVSAMQERTFRPIAQKYEKQAKGKSGEALKKIQEAMNKEMQSAQVRVQPQVQALAADTRNGILKLLTPAQRTKMQTLMGKPFKFQ
jgi:hypothetical protein